MIPVKKTGAISIFLLILFSSCKKSNYQDGGVLDPVFKGSSMEYLESGKGMFDTLNKVIRFAGMEATLRNQEVTFFAPPDPTIQLTIRLTNMLLYSYGKDTIRRVEQVKPEVWKKMLGKYMFAHKKSLNDYPQIDFLNIPVFPGQPYVSLEGSVMNVGVDYEDAGGIQYAGLRTLYLSYIRSMSAPSNSLLSAGVATSNIQTDNGYIHVLRYALSGFTLNPSLNDLDLSTHYFGFDPLMFYNEALNAGIDP